MSFQKGDIIVRADAIYPEGALVVDEFDLTGSLLAHPMGGGLQLIIPSSDIPRFGIADEFEKTRVFRRALFTIEGVAEKFKGFTDGRHWNGWAMPRFEFVQAQKVVAVFDPDNGHYNPAIDSFITITADGEEKSWPVETVALSDGGTRQAGSLREAVPSHGTHRLEKWEQRDALQRDGSPWLEKLAGSAGYIEVARGQARISGGVCG